MILTINGNIGVHEYEYDMETKECSIPPEQYLSFEEVVKDLPNRMSDVTLDQVKCTLYKDLIKFHRDFGMWIRNNYGLWQPDNPHVGDKHPDDYSFEMIQQFWKNLQDPTDFDNAMKGI